AWTVATLRAMERPLLECGVELVEQPLAPEHDRSVQRGAYPIPLAADESCQSLDDLPRLRDHFDAVVIKLDKSGGLTAALALHAAARQEGLKTMVSCMIGSSLGLAPAALLGARCDWVDLDLPVFLAEDRDPAMTLVQGRLGPAPAGLWGSGQTLRDGAASRP
ncbi:MAG: enolase C-terminal domain-like protein, partial [Myxococcota bacterium]